MTQVTRVAQTRPTAHVSAMATGQQLCVLGPWPGPDSYARVQGSCTRGPRHRALAAASGLWSLSLTDALRAFCDETCRAFGTALPPIHARGTSDGTRALRIASRGTPGGAAPSRAPLHWATTARRNSSRQQVRWHTGDSHSCVSTRA